MASTEYLASLSGALLEAPDLSSLSEGEDPGAPDPKAEPSAEQSPPSSGA